MLYIILAILGLGVIILIHEVGHFVAAKLNGVKVEEFAIGMGPKLFSIDKGETVYSIRAFPIGGYVQMLGENEDDEEQSTDKRALCNKSPLARAMVFAAGAFMNILLAIVIFVMITMNFGFKKNIVSTVIEESPAAMAGLMIGDKILEVNGNKIVTTSDLNLGIAMAKGNAVDVKLERNGEKITKNITPTNTDGGYIIGIDFQRVKNPTILDGVKEAGKQIVSLVKQTFMSLKMIVTGEANFKTDVGGPITIIKMSSEAAKAGAWNLLSLVAVLSVQIGVFNLLPFPALDGGHLFILLIESVTRKKIPPKVVGYVNMVGFMLLMALMLVVILKDIIFPVNI
ncbi:MAG: RIP metalloprotease RseP [Sarcina sp.]